MIALTWTAGVASKAADSFTTPSDAWAAALGWSGQALFSGRVLIQWLASERAGRPVAPRVFWWLSAMGAVLLAAYSALRGKVVMVPGYVVTLLVYVRNLSLARRTDASSKSASPAGWIVAGLLLAITPYAFGLLDHQDRAGPEIPWLAVAIAGQGAWIGRFLVQWRHAERSHRSEFPTSFWWMTLAGSALLFAYGLHRQDPVFVVGFLTSWAAPLRNLALQRRHARASS